MEALIDLHERTSAPIKIGFTPMKSCASFHRICFHGMLHKLPYRPPPAWCFEAAVFAFTHKMQKHN